MILAGLQQAVQYLAYKGATALVRAGVIGAFAAIGSGMITAALFMALALWIGVIWASLLLGMVFLAIAAGLAARRKPSPPVPAPAIAEVIFTLGFVAARALLRERHGNGAEPK